MNYERSNSRKQGHVELMLYDVLCTLTNSIEISSKSRFRVDLRALVRSLLSMRDCRITAGEKTETRQENWCDRTKSIQFKGRQIQMGRGCITKRVHSYVRTVKSRARPKGVNIKRWVGCMMVKVTDR